MKESRFPVIDTETTFGAVGMPCLGLDDQRGDVDARWAVRD